MESNVIMRRHDLPITIGDLLETVNGYIDWIEQPLRINAVVVL